MSSASDDARAPLSVHAVLLFVQVCFGLMHVVAKGVLDHLEPLQLAALRAASAAPLLIWMAWVKDRVIPARSEMPVLAGLGVLGIFLNQVLFVVGLNHTTASNAAILMSSIPAFALAVGAVLGIERIGPHRLAAVVLAIGGCVVLLDPTRFSIGQETTVGNLLILLNCLSFAAFLVLQRPILQRLPWRTVIAWSFLYGTVGILVVSVPAVSNLAPAAVPVSVWGGLAYIVLFPTFLGYALATWAVRRSSPSLVAIYTTAQPAVAALAAVLFLNESITLNQAIGFVLITAGVVVAGRAAARRGA